MAPLIENGKDSPWLWRKDKVRNPTKDARPCVHLETTGSVPEEPRQWCSFEFAELLEQGKGPGLYSTYSAPSRDPEAEQRLLVLRSPNKLEYQLTTENQEVLLVARVNADGTKYDLFVAMDSDQPQRALGPAFNLKASASLREWSLHSVRCEQCEARGKRTCGSRELARMTHYSETVGEGQAFCLDLLVPEVFDDGSSAVFCPLCGDGQSEWRTVDLTTRRPRWNAKHGSLTLDFRGRCSVASAKNFQLEDPRSPGQTRMLFGKVGPHQFVLDYRRPLSPAQAFAAALSVSHWK